MAELNNQQLSSRYMMQGDQNNSMQSNKQIINLNQKQKSSGIKLQIQENNIYDEMYDQPQTLLSNLFAISMFISFLGLIIIITDILLNSLNVDISQSGKQFFLKIGYCVSSIICISTYVYLSKESLSKYQLQITLSLRISFVFTLISLVLGIFIFTDITQTEWICTTVKQGDDCFVGVNYKPVNYEKIQCKKKLSSIECYNNLAQIVVKYGVLIFSGIPMICVLAAVVKYYYISKQRDQELNSSHIQDKLNVYKQNSDKQQEISYIQSNNQLQNNNINNVNTTIQPFLGNNPNNNNINNISVQQDEPNYFSNKYKYTQHPPNQDDQTYLAAISRKSMFNPNYQINLPIQGNVQINQEKQYANQQYPVISSFEKSNNVNQEFREVGNDQL